MSARTRTTRTRRPATRVPEWHEGQLLDWTASSHWSYTGPAPCRYCGRPTQLLDSKRRPAEKVCAEAALAAQYAQAVTDYQDGAL